MHKRTVGSRSRCLKKMGNGAKTLEQRKSDGTRMHYGK